MCIRDRLNITLKVDALALPNGDRTDQLATGSSDTYQVPLAKFHQLIADRSPFARYQPPRPKSKEVIVRQAAPPKDNSASRAKFSGIHYGEQGWLMLVRMEDSGELRYYREGDEISIGQFQGTVQQLDGSSRRAVINCDDRLVELRFGKTLAQAVAIKAPAG